MSRRNNPLLKNFRPVTPTLRFTQLSRFSQITTADAERSLTRPSKRSGGRNSYGRITSRRRGGGHKRRYRIIDFKRNKIGITGVVQSIEYDPFRSARIALIKYQDNEKRYILAPVGLEVGAIVQSGSDAPPNVGNTLPLSKVTLGAVIHNVELIPGRGAQLVRTAGSSAVLQAMDGDYAQVRLPSGEIRKINVKCLATIGQLGNVEHKDIKLGKAGRSRWLGRRPRVRGMAMNPVDHPNGGGNGKSKGGGGRQHPVSPWGQLAKGYKTRLKCKPSDKFIVQRRKHKKKK